jgi:hypothetical protein
MRKGSSQLNYGLLVSYSSGNFQAFKSFYEHHDILLGQGIRGALEPPPKTQSGWLTISKPFQSEVELAIELPRPTGVFLDRGPTLYVACDATNEILKISHTGVETFCSHPLFNQIHYIDIIGNDLIITCSGTDAIIAFDLQLRSPKWQWLATEQQYCVDPLGNTRVIDTGLDHRGKRYPTLMQSTHVNSAIYSRNGDHSIYASLFHQGEILSIDPLTGESNVVLSGLRHPHGLKCVRETGFTFCEASSSTITYADWDGRIIYSHSDPEARWIQDVEMFIPGVFAYLDVYNARIRVWDAERNSIVREIGLPVDLKPYQIRFARTRTVDQLVAHARKHLDFEVRTIAA